MIIKNIIIGEDVRQEMGNKISLMGIVGAGINVDVPKNVPKDSPVAVAFAVLLTIENTDEANDPEDFKVNIFFFVADKKIANLTARIDSVSGPNRILHLPVPRMQFGFTETATLSINAEIVKGDKVVSRGSAALDVNVNRI